VHNKILSSLLAQSPLEAFHFPLIGKVAPAAAEGFIVDVLRIVL